MKFTNKTKDMLIELKTLAKDWAEGREKEKRVRRIRHQRALKMCRECYTFYYNNSWHFEKPENLEPHKNSKVHVQFTQCPACLQQEIATYEMESDLVWRKV